MKDLQQLGPNTYYFDWSTKVGLYVSEDKKAYLIDTGTDKDTGRSIQLALEHNNWELAAIINTHSHADHIGGNNFLQTQFDCPVYGPALEIAFIEHPVLEPSYLYGGEPLEVLKNKLLLGEPSIPQPIEQLKLPPGFELCQLDGHSFAMIGIKTPDDIWFVADSIMPLEIIEKYHIFFLQDIEKTITSLERLSSLKGKIFVPSHGKILGNIQETVTQNYNKIQEIISRILQFAGEPILFDDLLKQIFDSYELTFDAIQCVLVGSTTRSYLSYLEHIHHIRFECIDNQMLWQTAL